MDSGKKLEISGHTDDVGSERYNQGLSERRAAAVKAQLVQFGVPAERIVTKGFGNLSRAGPTLPRQTKKQGMKPARKTAARKCTWTFKRVIREQRRGKPFQLLHSLLPVNY